MHTNKTATILNADAVVTQPVHCVLLNVIKKFHRYLINHSHTLAGLIPVSTFSTEKHDRSSGGTNGHAFATHPKRDQIDRKFGR